MPDFASSVEPAIASGACRHLAVLVNRPEDLPGVLSSFYALGARRGGWLVHRAMPSEADLDRARLRDAQLDVDGLEGEERMLVHEVDLTLPVADYGLDVEPAFDAALGRGLQSMWYARFAVGAHVADTSGVLAYDRVYEDRFAGRPVVTLCPFVVGRVAEDGGADDLAGIAALHDGVAIQGADGFALLSPRP